MKNSLLIVALVLTSAVLFAQTTQPTKQPIKEKKTMTKTPVKPKMEKPAKPKMPKMDMGKIPGADILKSAGVGNLMQSLTDMGIGKKEAKSITEKNMDLLKKVSTMVGGDGANWKSALKEVKGLNKANLKDIKGVLTKDQLKQYKPTAKKIWVAIKDFIVKALKK